MGNEDIVQEGKSLLARERAKNLISEAEALSGADLRGALGKLREALQISPDFPDLEDEIFLREDAIEKLDGVLQHIVTQLKAGKTYRAFQLLQELPENYIILDKTGTVEQLALKVNRVESLIAEARNLPRSGNSQALPMLEEAFVLMPDYPGLQGDIDALVKSREHYNDYIAGVEAAVVAGDTFKARTLLDQFKAVYSEDSTIGRLEVLIINKDKEIGRQKDLKRNFVMVAGIAAAVLCLIIAYCVIEIITFKSAERKWQEAGVYIESENFSEARAAAEVASKKLAGVRFLSQEKKIALLAKIEEVLSSEEVIQGAQGKILIDGSYIQKESLAGSQEARKIIDGAEKMMAAGNFTAAIAGFEEARKSASTIDAKLAGKLNKEIDDLISKCRIAHVKAVIRKASALHGASNYDDALAEFDTASNLAQSYGFRRNDTITKDIEKAADKTLRAKLDSLITDGDKLLNSADYESSIDGYKKALDFARANKMDSNETVDRLYGSINRARIYGLLAKGDENYSSSRWMDAIKYYNNAVELSVKAGLRNLPILVQAAQNIKLAEKRISLGELKRLELAAGKKFEESAWQEANESYKNLLAIAGSGDFRESPEFSAILKNATEKLAITEERIFINSRKEYLEEKYRGILKNAFGTSGDVTFLNPEVILLNSDEKVLKFSLTAKSYVKKGSDQGKYSNYEVQYAYDREKESWHLLDKSSNSQAANE